MHKKHMFLRVFQKIALFACVFCAVPAWSETTCDVDFTPVTGNSWQNGTPTPTNPVEIKSIGTKVGNKYAVQVAVNYDGGVVDLGTLNISGNNGIFNFKVPGRKPTSGIGGYLNGYTQVHSYDEMISTNKALYFGNFADLSVTTTFIHNDTYTDATSFKQAMSGKMLYYQRATDETWVAPTLKTVYLDEPLRKVGEYADVLDYKNGTITRNIGVKVLDGMEDWDKSPTANYFRLGFMPYAQPGTYVMGNCTHFQVQYPSAQYGKELQISSTTLVFFERSSKPEGVTDITSWKSWLAQQYAAGTPVTVYYVLATPVVEQIENWSCTPPITDIQIATTKMVDDEFAVAEANLAATVQTIESVVSRTIAQTGQIATLQETKQTRPDESCPANMKCLLVQDEDGTPHWYPIIEP